MATAAHVAEHVGANVVSWSTGKVIGGAIAQVAIAHGLPHELSKQVAESAIQAFTATALHARDAKNRTPAELAQRFIAEAAGAMAGKMAHESVDDSLLGGDAHVKAIATMVAGKGTGAATVAGVATALKHHAATLKNVLVRYNSNVLRADADLGTGDQLTAQERSALFDLTMAGWAIARHLKTQPKTDAMPTALDDRLSLAKLIGEELQSPGLYGAPIRIRKFNVQGKTIAGEFVGTEDGRSYSFTYTNGKVTYQPAVAKLDSESVNQFTARWDSHTEALEAKVSNPLRLDAAGKKLKCSSANYQCGGTCLGVHKSCHKNEKAAIDHDRLNKINALIEHLNQGGAHPSKALDKPDAAKLQATAKQIQETRGLRAANKVAGRAGDRIARAKQPHELTKAEHENRLNKAPLNTFSAPLTVDYGKPMRGQGRKSGGMVKGGMFDVSLQGKKTYTERFAKLPPAEKKEATSFDQHGRDAYDRHRAAGFSHGHAMVAGYHAEDKTVPTPHHFAVEAALKKGKDVPAHVLKDYPDLTVKHGNPATMTVGTIAPSIKPPQLIPQAKAVTPEVMPSEPRRKMRSRSEKDADHAKMQANLEDAARGIAHTAILQHAAYQTAMGAEVSPEATRQAQQAAGDMAVAKLRAGRQQPALPGTRNRRRLGGGEAIAAAQSSIKEAAISTGAAAVAQQQFMNTALQMAQEGTQQATLESEVAKRHATNVQALQGQKEGSAKEQPFTSAASREGVEPKTVDGVRLSTLSPAELKSMGHDGADEIHRRLAFEGHNMSFAQFKDHELNRARARHGGYLQDRMNAPYSDKEKHHRNVEDIEQVILGHTGSKGDRKLKEAHHHRVENAIESGELTVAKAKKLGHFQTHPDLAAKYAPLAPQTRSRTAGDLGDRGKHRHVSLDAIAGAIERVRDRGIAIGDKDAVDLLKGAKDCGCKKCKVRRKVKPEGIARADATRFVDKDAHAQATKEAKAKFKMFPSRYAGMWLAQRYQELVKAKRQKVGTR